MFSWLSGLFSGLGNEISSSIWNTMLRWLYTAIYDAIAEFFTTMGGLGVEIFDLAWVEAAVRLFSLFGWALFTVGMAVAVFDAAIEAQSGRVNIRATALNILKGFLAASLFITLPVELYKFCITLQNTFAGDLTRVFSGQQSTGIGALSLGVLESSYAVAAEVSASVFNLLGMVALAYCVIRIFFDNIKRGGILLIQIAVGSLHLFSVPRGYGDGFTQWCKQIVALCLTAFLQTTLLFMGLMTFSQNMLLGLGIMLSAAEVPRIAQQFGLETGTRVSVVQAMQATSTAVNLTRSVARMAK